MTIIKATCPECGDIRTDVGNVTLRFIAETSFDGAEYRFLCPSCKKIILKPTTQEIATMLYAAGVAVERYELPLELLERPIEGSIISLDDVLDLALQLEKDEAGWMKRMQGGE